MVWLCYYPSNGVVADAKSILRVSPDFQSVMFGLAVVLAQMFSLKSVRFGLYSAEGWEEDEDDE